MSFGNGFGTPFTLASLSSPVSSSNGRTHAAPVCSIHGVKKRKRTEIAVGLDGEGVSIYSLQNPQLVASYALPPSVTYTTSPYSIYRKGSSKTPSHRFTYAALSSSTSKQAQVVCFHDESLGDKTDTTKTSYSPVGEARILTIDSAPVAVGGSSQGPVHDTLLVLDDATITCLAADIKTERWTVDIRTLISDPNAFSTLEYACTTTARAAIRGLLRGRADVAAELIPVAEESELLDLIQVICIVGQDKAGQRTLSLFRVQSRSADLTTKQRAPLTHLVSWSLLTPPEISIPKVSTPIYHLHPASGVLHMISGASILDYDFTGTVPKASSMSIFDGPHAESVLRLAHDLVLVISNDTCRIFDTKFKSLQATFSLGAVATDAVAGGPSKKRKQGPAPTSGTPTESSKLVAYYADTGLVVALRGQDLIGVETVNFTSRKRSKTGSTLLIHALGKGIVEPSKDMSDYDLRRWTDRKAKLNRYAAKGKLDKFEAAFASDLDIEVVDVGKEIHREHHRENEMNGGPLTNGIGPKLPDEDLSALPEDEDEDEEEYSLRKWNISKSIPDRRRQHYRQYALYALSTIFSYPNQTPIGSQSPASIKVQLFPPNVFQWLLQTGQLTKEAIRTGLMQNSDCAGQDIIIDDGDIVKALIEFDPDLHILSAVLNQSQFLPIGEVVSAVKHLVQSLDDVSRPSGAVKLLTNGVTHSEDGMEVDIDSELEAASYEIEHALSILDHGLPIRNHALRPALIRLHAFSPVVISSTLRKSLPRRDLESLVRLLHFELKNGGWTSHIDSADPDLSSPDSPSEDPDDNAVAIIASLLNSTLDAIGAGAWLATVRNFSDSETSEETIESLHADTSEALSGFWEARYMRGLLAEFLRYASALPKSNKPSRQRLEEQSKPFAAGGDMDDLPMLPLGSKPEMGVELTKAGQGGKKEQRSQRAIGMLISRKVPKYSFERIVI